MALFSKSGFPVKVKKLLKLLLYVVGWCMALLLLYWMVLFLWDAGRSYVSMQNRAKEHDVKVTAHSLQKAVEDYKKTPERRGLKPGISTELGNVVADFLPENVQKKVNPFDKRQRYGAGGIVFGSPGGKGQIGYIFTDPGKPYQIVALGRVGTPILTLQEEP